MATHLPGGADWRIEGAEAVYHVVNHGNQRAAIFRMG
jgi:hypothetical protein